MYDANDIRDDIVSTTRVERDLYKITYTTHFNERRVITHLTYVDALRRAMTLRARSYNVTISRMFA